MPSLSEVFRVHPVYLPNSPVDLSEVREVLPESHVWLHLDAPSEESVPIIDLDSGDAVCFIGHACKTWGAFQLINHGFPVKLLEQVEFHGRRLFSLPMSQKLKAARKPDGVTGYGLARISTFFPKLMWSEGFTIVDSPLEQALQLWPNEGTQFCDAMLEFQKKMNDLARKVMLLMLAALGVDEKDVKWASLPSTTALQLNSYPPCPDPDRAMGLAAHTDSTILTMLYQSNVSGLQVFKDGIGWTAVPPVPGSLIVHVGDLFHILSNGQFPTVLHRAVVNRYHHRLSAAYLYGPPINVQISPIPKLIEQGQAPLFRSVTWNEYLKLKATYFDKALSYVGLCSSLK